MDYNCEFQNPVDWEGNPPIADTTIWEWKNVECVASGTTIISDGTYTAYIENKMDLGDIFVVGFLTIFFSILIFKFIWDFIFPKIFRIKTINDL